MTTQVILLNGLGIALASDSAVTAGGKVLNGSEKVFELPEPHKVAVLSSGRSWFMGHPWEVLLSAWSATLDSPLAGMIEYRESLYRFLRTVLPAGAELNNQEFDYLLDSYYADSGPYQTVTDLLKSLLIPFFKDTLDAEEYTRFAGNSDWDDDFRDKMSKTLSKTVIKEFNDELDQAIEQRKLTFFAAEEVSYTQAAVWVDKFWANIESTPFMQDFDTWPLIPGFNERVKELACVHIVHASYDAESNINFVGFGARDLFPSAAGVFFHGLVGGNIIKRFEGHMASSPEPRYVFFGQSDQITALTSGEDHLLTSTAVQTARKKLSDIYDQLATSTDEQAVLARDSVRMSLESDELAAEMKRVGNESRLQPFTKAIAMSPIIDLAEFAAQLVGVQAASAAMTQENPSVGGFVDVAVITHRRGFEWIRRKK